VSTKRPIGVDLSSTVTVSQALDSIAAAFNERRMTPGEVRAAAELVKLRGTAALADEFSRRLRLIEEKQKLLLPASHRTIDAGPQ
jgi:hypothetical protein